VEADRCVLVADRGQVRVLTLNRPATRRLAERVDAIAVHHEHRLAELLAVIRRMPGSTPWRRLTSPRSRH
jgi:hypothetical protein